jgi:hypothetical protein
LGSRPLLDDRTLVGEAESAITARDHARAATIARLARPAPAEA